MPLIALNSSAPINPKFAYPFPYDSGGQELGYMREKGKDGTT